MDKRPRSQDHVIEDFEVCSLPDKVQCKTETHDLQYISVSPFEPNRYIGFFKDGTYYCSFPQARQQRCGQVSESNSDFLRSQYTNIVRLPAAREK
jgi:hypothetical protein